MAMKGWALPSKRKPTRFSAKQLAFVKKIFDSGEVTGRKLSAAKAESLMKVDFPLREVLTRWQIAGLFSRFNRQVPESRQPVKDFDVSCT